MAFGHGVTNPSSTHGVDNESGSLQLALGTLTSRALQRNPVRKTLISAGNRLLVIRLQGKTQWLSPPGTKGMTDTAASRVLSCLKGEETEPRSRRHLRGGAGGGLQEACWGGWKSSAWAFQCCLPGACSQAEAG